jgi:hypothetical protein
VRLLRGMRTGGLELKRVRTLAASIVVGKVRKQYPDDGLLASPKDIQDQNGCANAARREVAHLAPRLILMLITLSQPIIEQHSRT